MRINPHPDQLHVGQTVETDYSRETRGRTFVIVEINEHPTHHCQSRRMVRVKGLRWLDAAWFVPAAAEQGALDL